MNQYPANTITGMHARAAVQRIGMGERDHEYFLLMA